MSAVAPLHAVLYFAAGAALGALYYGLLAWTVRLYTSDATAARIVPLYILRIAMAVVAFWFIAQQGTAALLVALAGFVIARFPIQWRYGSG